jgi:beta-lactam-binding protein with PASTA domain
MWRTPDSLSSDSVLPSSRRSASPPGTNEGLVGASSAAVEPARAALTTPDLIGLHVQDARRVARLSGLPVWVDDRPCGRDLWGRVLAQDPEPDTSLLPGDIVSITVGTRPRITVPDVCGAEETESLAVLRDAGLVPERRAVRRSDGVPSGHILRTRPRAGADVATGTRVSYVVAAAPRVRVGQRRRDERRVRPHRLPDGTFVSLPEQR